MRHRCNSRALRPGGMVLVAVLIVIAILSLAAFTFSDLMLTERKAVAVYGRQLQARALADSGLEMAKQFLTETPEERTNAGGTYDNPGRFRAVSVVEDSVPSQSGYFTFVAPLVQDGELSESVRFGLENESTRLNLSVLLVADQVEGGGRKLLMQLPGMTEQIADAILDWIDPDSEPRELGAEAEYYSGLSPPYAARNAPPETIEQLLLVRGVTPELLFGADLNRNGRIDDGEQAPTPVATASSSTTANTATASGVIRGWADYLTLYSSEKNVKADGTPRIDINGNDMQLLHDELSKVLGAEQAKFIVAYRQFGPYTGTAKINKASVPAQLDLKQPGKVPLKTVLDLIGVKAQITSPMSKEPTILEPQFPDVPLAMGTYLPLLLDNVSVNKQPVIPGRININQAPRTVLAGIPGMTPQVVEQIISQREPEPGAQKPERRHETWLLSEGLVTLAEMKSLMPFVTSGGEVYRTQIVGFFGQNGPAARTEAILDATSAPPRVLMYRELTHLGRGYTLSTLGAVAGP